MRFTVLYLRSRGAAAAVAVMVACTAVLCTLGALADDPKLSLALTVLEAALCAAAIGAGLVGADVDLERTAALAWPPRRAAHLAAAAALIIALLAGTIVVADPLAQFGDVAAQLGIVLRDVAGIGGLVALGAVTLGGSRAWMPPVGWAAPVAILGDPLTGTWYREVLTWMTQPPATTSATVTAVALAAAGTAAYAVSGGRR